MASLNNGCAFTRVPRPYETPTPLGSPQVPRHEATVGSYGGGGSGTPIDAFRTFYTSNNVGISALRAHEEARL